MDELSKRGTTDIDAATVKSMAEHIAHDAPELAELTTEQLEALSKIVVTNRLAKKLDKAADIAGIDYSKEKETFLNEKEKRSKETRRGYAAALARLEEYTDTLNITPLELAPGAADDYINSMNGKRAAASVRRDVAAASSFYTWLERRHESVKNPFRGTRARPPKMDKRPAEYPEIAEVKKILATLPARLAAAAAIMAFRGLRAGALPNLHITADRFRTLSKGKETRGSLPTAALDAIEAAVKQDESIDRSAPFAGLTANQIECDFAYYTRKLAAAGKIPAAYSAHDLRHFFAVTQYRKNKDIYSLSKLLNHSSIQVTELYLKGLNVID